MGERNSGAYTEIADLILELTFLNMISTTIFSKRTTHFQKLPTIKFGLDIRKFTLVTTDS